MKKKLIIAGAVLGIIAVLAKAGADLLEARNRGLIDSSSTTE